MSVPILKTSKLQTMILIKFKFSESFWMALFIMRWLWLTMRHSGLLCVTLGCYGWLWVTQVIPVLVIPVFRTTAKRCPLNFQNQTKVPKI